MSALDAIRRAEDAVHAIDAGRPCEVSALKLAALAALTEARARWPESLVRQASSPAGELAGPASPTTRTPASVGPEGRSPAVSATPPPAVPDTGAPLLSPAEALAQLLRELLALDERPIGLAGWRAWAADWLGWLGSLGGREGAREPGEIRAAEHLADGWLYGVAESVGWCDARVLLARACREAAYSAWTLAVEGDGALALITITAGREALAQYRECRARERAS